MPNAGEANFDHEALATTASELREAADALESTQASTIADLKEKVREETSVGTTSGGPAPIYANIIQSLDQGCDNALEKIKSLAETMRADADNYDKVSSESRNVEDATSASLDSDAT